MAKEKVQRIREKKAKGESSAMIQKKKSGLLSIEQRKEIKGEKFSRSV